MPRWVSRDGARRRVLRGRMNARHRHAIHGRRPIRRHDPTQHGPSHHGPSRGANRHNMDDRSIHRRSTLGIRIHRSRCPDSRRHSIPIAGLSKGPATERQVLSGLFVSYALYLYPFRRAWEVKVSNETSSKIQLNQLVSMAVQCESFALRQGLCISRAES